MNWRHFGAILWLRWRILLNQARRHGPISVVLAIMVAFTAVFAACTMFVAALGFGLLLLDDATGLHQLFVWDGVIVAFLVVWLIGLSVELQRSEVLALEKLLHFPISLSGAFVYNYLSSLITFSTVLFVPAMFGLAIATVVTQGPALFVVFPLLAGFLLMTTGVTYHFRGWLATLMMNKRRRRTIVATISVGFLLLSQLPNAINLTFARSRSSRSAVERNEYSAQLTELQRQANAGEISGPEFKIRFDALQKQRDDARRERYRKRDETVERVGTLASQVLPPGWVGYGVMAATQGKQWPGWLGALVAGLIGTASLWRSYKSTLRFYQGGYTSGKVSKKPGHQALETRTAQRAPAKNMLAYRLPYLPEQACAVALGTCRSLLRTPEVKLLFVTPVAMALIFGTAFFMGQGEITRIPDIARPLIAFGIIMMCMFTTMHLQMNQFGFDRSGFRLLMLAPIPRDQLLLGKNLAAAPFSCGLAVVLLTILQVLLPLRPTHFLASLLVIAAVFLVGSLFANLASIVAPTAMNAGSLRANRPKLTMALLQMLIMMLGTIALAPLVIPIAIDTLFATMAWSKGIPLYLLLAAGQLGLVCYMYRRVLRVQGNLLQSREMRILEAVTATNE